MSPARFLCAIPVKTGEGASSAPLNPSAQRGVPLAGSVNLPNDKYPLQVLILLPHGYEPCALPMS